jgi:hypothetical protein
MTVIDIHTHMLTLDWIELLLRNGCEQASAIRIARLGAPIPLASRGRSSLCPGRS